MTLAWWITPAMVIAIAIWCAALGWINVRAAILIVLSFLVGICWAGWWLIHVNGRYSRYLKRDHMKSETQV